MRLELLALYFSFLPIWLTPSDTVASETTTIATETTPPPATPIPNSQLHKVQIDEKEDEKAASDYEQILKEHPNDTEYLIKLGLLNVRLGHRKEAIDLYIKALQLQPDNEQVKTALAFAYLFEKDYQNSEKIFQQILEKSPDNADALAGLGYLALLKGDLNRADFFLHKALTSNPAHVTARIYQGILRLRQEQIPQAEEIFQKLYKEDPHNADVKQGLLDVLEAEKRAVETTTPEKKIEVLTPPVTTKQNDDADLVKKANLLRQEKKYKEAIELYTKALQLQPDNEQVMIPLAFAYLFEKDYQKSEITFQKIVEKSPDNPDALAGLGYLALLKGALAQADFFLNRALISDPEHVTARIYLGILRLRQHQIPQAEEIFQKLYIEDPHNPDVKQGLLDVLEAEKGASKTTIPEKKIEAPTPPVTTKENGDAALVKKANLLREEKKYKEAAEIYEDLVTSNPTNVDYLAALGQLYVTTNRKSEATSLYERALSLQPKRDDIRTLLAFVYLFQDQLKDSQILFQNVLTREPANADALAGLGSIATKNNQLEEAENYLQQALHLDAKNTTALIYFAALKMKQHDYREAYNIYHRLIEIDANNPDAIQGLKDAREKALNEDAKNSIKEKNYQKAENIYLDLAHLSPKNIDYLLDLVAVYKLQNDPAKVLQTLQHILALAPDRQDIRLSLAFAYLTAKELDKSKENFQIILLKESENSEALAGIGRIAALQNHPEVAENYYQRALNANPNDATALEYQAILKLQQKKYAEALAIYAKLLSIDPLNADFRQGFYDSQEKPLFERAKKLRDDKDFVEASTLTDYLISLSPKNEYILLLGSLYNSRNLKDKAGLLYSQALKVTPNDIDIKRALGFIYLNKALDDAARGVFRWCCSRFPFLFVKAKTNLLLSKIMLEDVLQREPRDASALAGLGRIALLEGNSIEAENLYFDALYIEPENTTALAYLSALQSLQKKYCTANTTFQYALEVSPDDDDLWNNYKEFLKTRKVAFDGTGYYEEENEKDHITEEWVARLKNYGAAVGLIAPVQDQWKVGASIASDYILLLNLITTACIYSLEIKRPRFGFSYQYSPYLSLTGGMGLAYFSQRHPSIFYTRSGHYFLPYFNVSYSKNYHTCYLETVGDAPIVARNFVTNKATLIARQFINGFYEYDFSQRRLLGAAFSQAWYHNRIKNNQYQLGSLWLQMTHPSCWENFSLRYQFVYGRFNDLTIDYYTYRPQTSHYLKVDFTKKWCGDQVVTEAGYSHCWQRSFEQGQIITITPIPAFHWVHRQIDAAYARAKIAVTECLDALVIGTYSHDNFDYTTASISANLHLLF